MQSPSLSPEDALVLADSLKMLAKVSDYLKRMPAVPATLQLVRRIDKHLEDPKTLVAQRMAEAREKEMDLRKQTRSAATYTPAGLPVLQVQVCGEKVTLKLGDGYLGSAAEYPQRQRLVSLAMRQLHEGVELPLQAPPTAST